MSFNWQYDAPNGVYKNHQMSSKLRMAAIAETKFMQFVSPEEGYGKAKGESITITRVSNITVPTNGRLSEQTEIPQDELVLSTIAITVSEWGRAVPYTSLSTDLAKYDIGNVIQKKLRDQMALVMDSAAAAAFKAGKIKATPNGVASLSIATNGVAPATASVNLNAYHIAQIRDYMFSTLNIPAYEGGDYMCMASTKALRGLKSDPDWEVWHKYTDPQAKYNSEVGKFEGIRFIEVNNTAALSSSLGTGGVLGEAIFFGDDAVAMAVAQDPELRTEVAKDFGRSKNVAWYGILEFGQIWGDSASAGEAKVLHVTSL
jgi:N4-gp56 family major capsid protein